jgi:hypothetical protein
VFNLFFVQAKMIEAANAKINKIEELVNAVEEAQRDKQVSYDATSHLIHS